MTAIDVFNIRPHQEKKPHGFKALASQWTLLKPCQWHLLLYLPLWHNEIYITHWAARFGRIDWKTGLQCFIGSTCSAFSNSAIKARLSGLQL